MSYLFRMATLLGVPISTKVLLFYKKTPYYPLNTLNYNTYNKQLNT